MRILRGGVDRNHHVVLGIDGDRLAIGALGLVTTVLTHRPAPAITRLIVGNGPYRLTGVIDPASRQQGARRSLIAFRDEKAKTRIIPQSRRDAAATALDSRFAEHPVRISLHAGRPPDFLREI